jgi:hypothetical protein
MIKYIKIQKQSLIYAYCLRIYVDQSMHGSYTKF